MSQREQKPKPGNSGGSGKRAAYYKAQFERTKSNKARRAKQRARKAEKRKAWNDAKRARHLEELAQRELPAPEFLPPTDPMLGIAAQPASP